MIADWSLQYAVDDSWELISHKIVVYIQCYALQSPFKTEIKHYNCLYMPKWLWLLINNRHARAIAPLMQ